MSESNHKTFGDPGAFSIVAELVPPELGTPSNDPRPADRADADVGRDVNDPTWGRFELWAQGRCLTRSQSVEDRREANAIEWSLRSWLEWVDAVGIRLINEDPFPRMKPEDEILDGCAWAESTLKPPLLDEDAEDRWWVRRSEWLAHHSLRRAFEGAAVPNVVFRRVGDNFEISWDNERSPSAREDIVFLESRGRAFVAASEFARVLAQSASTLAVAAAASAPEDAQLQGLARSLSHAAAKKEDWRWLVHRPTAKCIRDHLPELARSLDAHAETAKVGRYVPHSFATSVLRVARLDDESQVQFLLKQAEELGNEPWSPSFARLVRPRRPTAQEPWRAGNEYAELVREQLGWGVDPAPDLRVWSQGEGVELVAAGLPYGIRMLGCRRDAGAGVAIDRHKWRGTLPTMQGTALGHILMDEEAVSTDGEWEDWPSAARARAFGVALLLPEQGVRERLASSSVTAEAVRDLMAHYGTGAWATTHRLRNLGLIGSTQQEELLQDL
jgi:hypothetical protein